MNGETTKMYPLNGFDIFSLMLTLGTFNLFGSFIAFGSASAASAFPLSFAASCCITTLVLCVGANIRLKHPDKTFFQAMRAVCGKTAGSFLGYVMAAAVVVYLTLLVREICELICVYYYPETPSYFILTMIFVCAAISGTRGIKSLARCASIVAALLLMCFFILFSFEIGSIDAGNFLPVLGHSRQSAASSCLYLCSAAVPSLLILMLPPSLFDHGLKRQLAFSSAGYGLLAAVCVAVLIGVLGYPAASSYSSGFIELARLVPIDQIIMRFDAFFLGFFICGSTAALAAALRILADNIKSEFFPDEDAPVLLPLSLLLLFAAMLPVGYYDTSRLLESFRLYGGSLLLPLLLGAFLRSGRVRLKTAVFLAICLLPFSLTACYDYSELDESTYILAMGVDMGKDNDGGYFVTLMLPENSEVDHGTDTNNVYSFECGAPYEAVLKLSAVVPGKVNLSHLQVLVISSEAAGKVGITETISSLMGNGVVRNLAAVFISEKDAEEIIKLSSKVSDGAYKACEALCFQAESSMGDQFRTISNAANELFSSDIAFLLPYCAAYGEDTGEEKNEGESQSGDSGDDGREAAAIDEKSGISGFIAGQTQSKHTLSVEVCGSVLIKDGVALEKLDSYETLLAIVVNGGVNGAELYKQAGLSGGAAVMISSANKTKLSAVMVSDDIMRIKADISLSGSLISSTAQTASSGLLSAELSDMLVRDIALLLEKCMMHGADIFGFHREIMKNFATIGEFESCGFDTAFSNAEAEVNVKFEIVRGADATK